MARPRTARKRGPTLHNESASFISRTGPCQRPRRGSAAATSHICICVAWHGLITVLFRRQYIISGIPTTVLCSSSMLVLAHGGSPAALILLQVASDVPSPRLSLDSHVPPLLQYKQEPAAASAAAGFNQDKWTSLRRSIILEVTSNSRCTQVQPERLHRHSFPSSRLHSKVKE